MRSPVKDLRFGFRALLRAPGFAFVAVSTLALGIGVTSAVFSIVNGCLIDGLPWGHPETVISFEFNKLKQDVRPRAGTPAQFADFKQQSASLQALIAVRGDQVQLTDRDDPHLSYAPRVSTDALRVMQIKPLRGRGFSEADGLPGAHPVIMLSERLWADRYGRDETLIGRDIQVNGQSTTVIGVTSAAQWFPEPSAELVQPLAAPSHAPSREDQSLGLSGRLKPNVSLAQAQAEVQTIMQRLGHQYPDTDGEMSVRLHYTRDRIVAENGRRALLLLMGAVGFVLLIACANLANLLLARAAAREKEIATRSAVGATRAQIVAQLLWECAAIAILAFPLAMLLARLCLDYFISLVPSRVAWIDQFFRFDLRVVGFAAIVTGLTVLAFGLAPALKASKLDLTRSLNAGGNRGGTDSGSHRLRSVLVVSQIALSLSLLVSASLCMQAFTKMQHADPGFELDGVSSASIALPQGRYGDAEKIWAFQRELAALIGDLGGRARAAFASVAPLAWGGPLRDFQIAGRETAGKEDVARARWSSVSPEYFSTLGLRVQAGRAFAGSDRPSSQPVAIVSSAFVDRFFDGKSPVGQRIDLRALEQQGPSSGGAREIVGVVSDVRSFGGFRPPELEPRIYEPMAQQPTAAFNVLLRGDGTALAGISELRQRLRGLDRELALAGAATMQTRLDLQLWQSDFFATLMAILGGLALLLATVGVYGVVSYSTARRTREFGIRAALGAEPRQIGALVLRKTAVLAAWGVAIGLVLALMLGRALQGLLYEVSGRDPATLVGLSLLLALITIAAGGVPTWRATRANPMQSLRVE